MAIWGGVCVLGIVTPVNIVLSRPRPREGKKALKHEEEDDDENEDEDELCDLIVSSVLSTPSPLRGCPHVVLESTTLRRYRSRYCFF